MSIKKNAVLIPSICKIFFATLDEIESQIVAEDRFHRDVNFKDGHGWKEIYFTPGTADFIEKPKQTDSGELIEQSLKFFFPGEDESNMVDLDGILERPAVFKIQFTAVSCKLLGDMENGAKLSQVYQMSSKLSGSQLEITCIAAYRACWIPL